MGRETVGLTEVIEYDSWASYNGDASRTASSISFVQQDQSVVVGGKRYSQNSECYVGSDVSGISKTGNWFLAGEATMKPYFDVNVVGSVQRASSSGACGFFALGVRRNSTETVINQFQWLCKVGGSIPQLRVVVNGFSVKLYCKVLGGQYASGHIHIYNQCNRYNKDDNKVCFFTLKDSTTIIPEADVPSGTDIADVPYLLKTAAAAGSQKVLQTYHTGNYERKVLLGENNNTTQQDAVYKSPNLTYNPNSKTLTAPIIKNPNGSWVHTAEGVAGQSGYVKVATIKINTVYTDQPLTIQFTERTYVEPVKLYIRFNSENNTDPTLASFYYESGRTRFGEYLHKSATGTWDLYIEKGQGWDKIIILSCENPYAFLSPNPNYSITWQDELVTTLPTDYVESIMTTKRIHISGNSASATNSAFMQSLEGLSHKSIDSSLSLQRKTEYICGQQVLSDTEEAGKAFYGSSANPLVISVPFKDPSDAVAGDKVNVNLIRYYYSENYWHEVSYGVNTPYTYTRWVSNGTAWPWHRIMKEGVNIEYDAWVIKATTATNADVANKTKYPIVFKRNGASITNWFADTTFAIDIPEELLDYSAPTGITLKVPEISVANEAKKVSNDLEIRVNGKQKATFDGSSAKTVNIEASRSHFVKASMYGEGWTSPPAGATTPGVPLILDTSYMIPFGTLQDGDTIIMQVPNTLTSTSGYPVYLRLDTTEGNVAGNLVKIIKAQNAGNPVEWKGTTALTAGYYHFVYSEGAGGLIFMYRNVSTS